MTFGSSGPIGTPRLCPIDYRSVHRANTKDQTYTTRQFLEPRGAEAGTQTGGGEIQPRATAAQLQHTDCALWAPLAMGPGHDLDPVGREWRMDIIIDLGALLR
ncbi:hypothetical protein R1flu_018432 [Riccia fluitans]|uniref:Uncharacterized protein n=1 Tax=Riccia fluitans TaxID=41844 RepID=A0ABD1ZJA3_9MARC